MLVGGETARLLVGRVEDRCLADRGALTELGLKVLQLAPRQLSRLGAFRIKALTGQRAGATPAPGREGGEVEWRRWSQPGDAGVLSDASDWGRGVDSQGEEDDTFD